MTKQDEQLQLTEIIKGSGINAAIKSLKKEMVVYQSSSQSLNNRYEIRRAIDSFLKDLDTIEVGLEEMICQSRYWENKR